MKYAISFSEVDLYSACEMGAYVERVVGDKYIYEAWMQDGPFTLDMKEQLERVYETFKDKLDHICTEDWHHTIWTIATGIVPGFHYERSIAPWYLEETRRTWKGRLYDAFGILYR